MRPALWVALTLGLWLVPVQAEVRLSGNITAARLTQPTDRYDHGVLGDAVEWGGLVLTDQMQGATGPVDRSVEIALPQNRVFEDVEARVLDLDGDGDAEVLVVETDLARGASLAVYDASGRVTATPFIGRRHRWLAPLDVGDLDGDGLPEIAYVDRPHLAKELVILRYRNHKLTEVARIGGLTNHRIGDTAIAGGIRHCGHRGEAVLLNAAWSQVMAVTLQGKTLAARVLGPYRNADSLTSALACKN